MQCTNDSTCKEFLLEFYWGGENVLYIASLPLAHVPSPNYGQTEELIKEIKLTASKTNNELYK